MITYIYHHRGYTLQQNSYNWHFIIIDDSKKQCVFHSSCTSKLSPIEGFMCIEGYIESQEDNPFTRAYLINSIEEFGKFISFLIECDVSVWRLYWDEREKGDRCYFIDWKEKKCFYGGRNYWEDNGYTIVIPEFELNKFGQYKMK